MDLAPSHSLKVTLDLRRTFAQNKKMNTLKKSSITPKQKEVYHYIRDYFSRHGSAPTQREIKEYFGLKSFGSVQRYIKYLVDAGYLEGDWNARRGLRPTEEEEQIHKKSKEQYTLEVPLLGRIAAGGPIPAIEYLHDMVSVPLQMIKKGKEYFALNVVGESMIEDGILNGDIVICEKQSSANNGDTVVALIDGNATLKRFYKSSLGIELRPANSTMKPILLTDGPLIILGAMVGLIRIY